MEIVIQIFGGACILAYILWLMYDNGKIGKENVIKDKWESIELPPKLGKVRKELTDKLK